MPTGSGWGAPINVRSEAHRLEEVFLYLITPARSKAKDLEDFLAGVIEAGVDMVQLREKEMEGGPLLEHCLTVRRITRKMGALFVVNDRVDLALAADADGVHVGQDDLPVAVARAQMGPGRLIGLSTHSPDQVLAANDSGCDYMAVGPVHATPTKPGRPAVGLELVRFAADRARIPFFPIGGIDAETLPQVREAGGRRAAVLRAVTEAEDPPAAVRKLRTVLLKRQGP